MSNVATAATPPSLGTSPVVTLPKRRIPKGRPADNTSAVKPNFAVVACAAAANLHGGTAVSFYFL